MKKIQRVYITGAGPGGIEFLPLTTLHLLKKADVILYDGLVNREIILASHYKSKKICTKKLSQTKINHLLWLYAKKFATVIRLKQGCPSIFAHTGEEIDYLKSKGIETTIIPGISSPLSAPLKYNIPVTQRDTSSSVAIITGKRKDPSLPPPVVSADTLIYLMGVNNLPKIVELLLEKGVEPDTPVLVIENSYSLKERYLIGTLSSIIEISLQSKLKPPSVIVIGNILKKYFPSHGNILFTGSDYSNFFKQKQIYHLPLINIQPLKSYKRIYRFFLNIKKYDYIIFTSKYAVKYFYIIFNSVDKDIRELNNIKFCCIGKKTEEYLFNYLGIKSYITSRKELKDDLIKELKKENLKGKHIFYPCSTLSDKKVKKELEKQHCYIDMVPIYSTTFRKIDFPFSFNGIKEIYFTSPSTVKSFIKNFKKFPEGVKIKSIGKITQKVIDKYSKSI